MAQIFGTISDDNLIGTSADEYLNGGPGNDTLSGGAGKNDGVDNFGMSLGGGQDVVADFGLGTHANPYAHDRVVFDGWGNFVDFRWPYQLATGQAYATDAGHVMTVGQDATGSLTLTWDTGDSLTLQGVAPGDVYFDWLASLNSYGYVF